MKVLIFVAFLSALNIARCLAADVPTCPQPGGSEVILYPKPDNCSQYYECDNGRLVTMDCPPGLEFNAANSTCDFTWSAHCQVETRMIVVVRSVVADDVPSCPQPGGSEVILYPKPDNCSQYYECDNGRLVTMDCPPGLEFNAVNSTCDFTWSANCQEETSMIAVVKARSADVPTCPPPGPGNFQIFAKPDNCSQYYECDNGRLLIMDCPAGLQFNAANKTCDYPYSANCQEESRLMVVPRTREADDVPTCPNPGVGETLIYPKPDNCSQYYECDNGKLLVMSCPPGLEFNAVNKSCDFSWSANCHVETRLVLVVRSVDADEVDVPTCPPPGDTEVVLYPKPDNCSQYYECDNGRLVTMDCPPGLEFNAVNSTCDYYWSANCQEESRALAVLKTRAADVPTCPNPGVGETLIFPKPDNCSQYYECDNGQLLTMDCPPGLEFNAANSTCDFTWSANCKVESRAMTLVVKHISLPMSLRSELLIDVEDDENKRIN